MLTGIMNLWSRLAPQGRQALIEGQLDIASQVDKMSYKTPADTEERYYYWITQALELIGALVKLYPKANDNSND